MTHSTIRKDAMPTAPLLQQSTNVVGISGVAAKIPITQNLTVEYGPLEAQHAFLLAENTPVNLLGFALSLGVHGEMYTRWGVFRYSRDQRSRNLGDAITISRTCSVLVASMRGECSGDN